MQRLGILSFSKKIKIRQGCVVNKFYYDVTIKNVCALVL
jgi:hypothetical protein